MKVKLSHFFESSVDMLCIANYDGYFVEVNPAFVNLLGYSKEELLLKKINEFVFQEDMESTQRMREDIHKNRALMHFQNRYVSKSGHLVWLSWSAVPVDDERLVYAIAKDITHEMELKKERLDELNKLKNFNEDLIRINYTTSHDLRAPVNNLLSLFDVLDFGQIENEDTIQILRYMEISAKGVKESLENYLDLIEDIGKDSIDLSEVFFEQILTKVTNTLGSLLKGSNTKLISDFSACKSVIFDSACIESIFLNLITNSIKYCRLGIAPIIEVRTQIKEGHKELIFKDNGQGFDMVKNGDKIFGLNQRFNEIQEGKGVGLYLIHSQITNLGGNILLESEPNKGAIFQIIFPN